MTAKTFPTVGFLAGMVMASAMITTPAGWLLCDGALLNRADYLALYAAIGTAYNVGGETATQFRLPNLKGKVIVMQDSAQTEFAALGTFGGSKISTAPHTHGLQNHTHSGTSASPNDNTSDVPNDNNSDGVNTPTGWQNANTGHLHWTDHFHGASIGNTGWAGNGQHNGHYNHGGYASEAPEPGNFPGGSIPVNVNTAGGWSGDHDRQHQHGLEGHQHTMKNHTHTMKLHTHTLTTGAPNNNTSTGGSADVASGNLPPYLTLNYLIKT